MGRQVKIFDLLTKKQSLSVFKSQKKKGQLSEELKQNLSYQKQLLDILKSTGIKATHKTASEIQSESWYNLKIQDELIAITNRIDFLSTEIKNQNIQVALAADKQKKYEDKKNHYRKLDQLEKESKREHMMPSRTHNESKI